MSAVLRPFATLEFAPMRLDEVDDILEIETRAYPFAWSRTNFTDSLQAGYSAWCCRFDAVLIGYAVMMLVLDEAHLLNITVAPPWQRRGHGLAIMRRLGEIARAHGAHRMFLEVRPSNTAGQGLYDRLGFETIGRRRGYYPAADGREDAVVRALTL